LFNILVKDIEKKIPILVDKGRDREAEEIYMSSLKALEASLGKSHDRTLRFTSNYGIVLRETGQHAQALRWLKRAYISSLESLGPHHADTLRRKRRLDCVLDVMKERNIDIVPKKEEEKKETELVVLEGSDV
jgi:tetratricopeptide (TPR) repeat protein